MPSKTLKVRSSCLARTCDDVEDEVSGVRITSEAGLSCVLFTPWPNRAVAPKSVSMVQESPGGGGGGDEGDDAHGVAINIPVGWDAEASGRSDLTRLSGGPMWSQRLSSSTPGDPHRGGGDDGTWWVWWWWRWCNVRGGGLQCARLF